MAPTHPIPADSQERQQVAILLEGERRLLEMIARGDALLPVLDSLCRLVEQVFEGTHCSILLLGPTGNRLWHGAAPSLPPAYAREFDGILTGPETGPCGRAVYFQKPVEVPDIASDPVGGSYATLALGHGLHACWSTPIVSSTGKALGAFALYRREPGTLPEFQRDLVGQSAHLASIAIERKQAADALRASEHLARGQLDALRHTLDRLGQEPAPDRLLEHVLRAIMTECRAHCVSVWEQRDAGANLVLVSVLEPSRYLSAAEIALGDFPGSIALQDHPVWREVFRTGQHAVLEDIDLPCSRAKVGAGSDSGWQRLMADDAMPPSVGGLKQHLRTLGLQCVLYVPLRTGGRPTGIIGVRFKESRDFRPEEIELTQALAHQAMLALQMLHLSEKSRQAAVMAERNRMARDIHDTLAQGFTGIIIQLEAAADASAQGLVEAQEHHLALAAQLARDSLVEARRSVHALRPSVLESRRLDQALDELFRRSTAGTALQCRMELHGPSHTLPPGWEDALVRVCQEVVTNALRHARASELQVSLRSNPGVLTLELRDNGQGFHPAARHDGFGLTGMRERVEGMGGRLVIQSAPGCGTTVAITLPLTENAESSPA